MKLLSFCIMGEIFLLGTSIGGTSRKKEGGPCKGYSPDLPTPTWDSLLTLFAKEHINDALIMFLGKVGSDGRCGATGWGKVTREDIQMAPWKIMPKGEVRITKYTKDPAYTSPMAHKMIGYNVEPAHIVGIYVEKLP